MRIVPIVVGFVIALPAVSLAQTQKPNLDYLQRTLARSTEFRCDSVLASDCFAILARRVGDEKAEPDKFCKRFPKACVQLLEVPKDNERR